MSVPCDVDRGDGDENDRDSRASSMSHGTPSRRRPLLKYDSNESESMNRIVPRAQRDGQLA